MISGGRSPDGLKCGGSSTAFNFKSSFYGWVIGGTPDGLWWWNDRNFYAINGGDAKYEFKYGSSSLDIAFLCVALAMSVGAVGGLPITTRKHSYKLNTPLAER